MHEAHPRDNPNPPPTNMPRARRCSFSGAIITHMRTLRGYYTRRRTPAGWLALLPLPAAAQDCRARLLEVSPASSGSYQWVDVDTPSEACTKNLDGFDSLYQLVFSDEFNQRSGERDDLRWGGVGARRAGRDGKGCRNVGVRGGRRCRAISLLDPTQALLLHYDSSESCHLDHPDSTIASAPAATVWLPPLSL